MVRLATSACDSPPLRRGRWAPLRPPERVLLSARPCERLGNFGPCSVNFQRHTFQFGKLFCTIALLDTEYRQVPSSNKTQNLVRIAGRHFVDSGIIVASRQKIGALSFRDKERDALL